MDMTYVLMIDLSLTRCKDKRGLRWHLLPVHNKTNEAIGAFLLFPVFFDYVGNGYITSARLSIFDTIDTPCCYFCDQFTDD